MTPFVQSSSFDHASFHQAEDFHDAIRRQSMFQRTLTSKARATHSRI